MLISSIGVEQRVNSCPYTQDDIDIEEDPSFPLPHESSSEEDESGNETEGKQHQIIDVHTTASSFYELQR